MKYNIGDTVIAYLLDDNEEESIAIIIKEKIYMESQYYGLIVSGKPSKVMWLPEYLIKEKI